MKKPWVILDADNTLWDTESLYDDARAKLVTFLGKFGIEPDAVDAFQRKRDAQLFQWWGYHRVRFPISFQDTVEHFIQNPKPSDVKKALSMAEKVFETQPAPMPSVKEVLKTISAQNTLGLITSGDKKIQTTRIKQFPYKDFFDEDKITIVGQKSEYVFREYCKSHNITPVQSWVIGDSLRSDIIPARGVGLGAIHVGHGNWHDVERHTLALPRGAFHVDTLAEVPNILMQHHPSGE